MQNDSVSLKGILQSYSEFLPTSRYTLKLWFELIEKIINGN